MNRNLLTTLAILMIAAAAWAGTLQGTVYLPNDGGPAAGATVTVQANHGDEQTATTDDAGFYLFADLEGRFEVEAELEGYRDAHAMAWVFGDSVVTLDLTLRAPLTGFGSVEGHVYLPNDGGPAAGATVELQRNPADPALTATTDDAGYYLFADIETGGYDGEASLEGYESVHRGIMVRDAETITADFTLRAGEPTGSGTVNVLVVGTDGAAVAGADVALNGRGDGNHHGRHYHGETDDAGMITFEEVLAGHYVVVAGARMMGHASAEIDVADLSVTDVTLTLEADTGHGGGGHHGDSLTIVELSGVAIVETIQVDSLDPSRVRTRYYLDVDADGVADYRLAFGPPWYDPNNGATRPANGDEITVTGGLLTYADPQIVVVYTINGQFWREPRRGHGGHGGGDHGRRGCNSDSVTAVELAGVAMVRECDPIHGQDRVCYAIDTDADGAVNAFLDFGAPDYDPGNGATRPLNGEAITIVGGEIYCPNAPVPMVIVYEINGMFWRLPGDTLGLGPVGPTAADEPVAIGTPTSFVTARNFPNPFNPSTIINYSIPTATNVRLAVYDVTGREVAVLVSGNQAAGSYAVNFDARNMGSGLYFYRLTAGATSVTNKMMLLR